MLRRILGGFLASVTALGVLALPAVAHVNIDPKTADQGSYAVLTFRVPNETDNAKTVGIRVQLPPDHPLASVSVQPKPGWTYKATTKKLDKPLTQHGSKITEAVSEIDWSGGVIEPGEFDTFSISVGPLPTDTDQLVFKTLQEYEGPGAEKSEVAWIDESKPGQPDPEHPAPTLTLTPASAEPGHGSSASPAMPATGSAETGSASKVTVAAADGTGAPAVAAENDYASSSTGTIAIVLGALGLVAGLAALGVALSSKKRSTAPQ
ncbi:MAG: YcnI family protein [Aquihabitans sp.]